MCQGNSARMCLVKCAPVCQGKSAIRCLESPARVFQERIARACHARCSAKSARLSPANSASLFLARVASPCRGNNVPMCRSRVATACRGRIASRCRGKCANKCQENSARPLCQSTPEASRWGPKKVLSGSEVHLLVTTIWQVDGPKTLNSGSNDDFTSSDRRFSANFVLGGFNQLMTTTSSSIADGLISAISSFLCSPA